MEENKMKQPASADAPQTAEDSVLHVDRDRAQQKTKDIDMETAPEKPVSAHKCLESMPLKILGLLGICALIGISDGGSSMPTPPGAILIWFRWSLPASSASPQ